MSMMNDNTSDKAELATLVTYLEFRYLEQVEDKIRRIRQYEKLKSELIRKLADSERERECESYWKLKKWTTESRFY